MALWNELTTKPIARCQELTKRRRVQALQRLQDRPLAEWAEVIRRIEASSFCHGQNDRGWVATFDWLLQPDVATKTLEGKYDDRDRTSGADDISEAQRDWFEDCQRQHNGECGLDRYRHFLRLETEAARAVS
jgi:hypothetical protein